MPTTVSVGHLAWVGMQTQGGTTWRLFLIFQELFSILVNWGLGKKSAPLSRMWPTWPHLSCRRAGGQQVVLHLALKQGLSALSTILASHLTTGVLATAFGFLRRSRGPNLGSQAFVSGPQKKSSLSKAQPL